MSRHRTSILNEIDAERVAQHAAHGDQTHLHDGTGPGRFVLERIVLGAATLMRSVHLAERAKQSVEALADTGCVRFADILLEEVFEALAEDDPARLRTELVQVAAVAVQWIEAIDQRALAALPALPVAPPAVSPDCRVGKCRACSGDGGWDDEREALVPCCHDCHGSAS